MFPRSFILTTVTLAGAPLSAAPPANDNFASRIPIVGSTVTGTNDEATEEAGEFTGNGLAGATVWWSWQAPASEWVKLDTGGSDFDTVLQISTGSTLAGQNLVAFNDQAPDRTLVDASSITFLATAGTVYNISVGGWSDLLGPYTGNVTLRVTRGAPAMPAFWPASLALTPGTADVTLAPVTVAADVVIAAPAGSSGAGVAGIGFGWERSLGDGDYTGEPVAWNTALPQSGAPRIQLPIPRFSQDGPAAIWFKIVPDDAPPIIFSGPGGGSGYALPPAAAASLTIVNSCPLTDDTAPNVTDFSITPTDVQVTAAPATLQVSATVIDSPAGAGAVRVKLKPLSAPGVHSLSASLALTSGTAQNGTWTGTITVPKLYATDNYSVELETVDTSCNTASWGRFSDRELPGPNGDVDVSIVGGGVYEQWARTSRFAPGDLLTGPLDDADGDGYPNLISFAFRMNPKQASLSAGSLPVVELTGTGNSRRLRLTYLRRKNMRGNYQPEFTSAPSGVWDAPVNAASVTSISDSWERVVIDDSVAVSAEKRRFARVKFVYGP